jgi:hypothetical protein
MKAVTESKNPIKITWENVNYTVMVPTSKEEKLATG